MPHPVRTHVAGASAIAGADIGRSAGRTRPDSRWATADTPKASIATRISREARKFFFISSSSLQSSFAGIWALIHSVLGTRLGSDSCPEQLLAVQWNTAGLRAIGSPV